MDPKISFIVPVYNVENYLSMCIDSIYSQFLNLDDFEVICINDCSTDHSANILESYVVRYSNFILIEHDKNQGLSSARNTGIKASKGKYLWFVDSDDKIEINVTKKLYSYAFENNLDILLFNYQDVESDGKFKRLNKVFETTKPQNGILFIHDVFGREFVYHMGYVWRFLIKRSYLRINSFYFPEGEYWEDTVYFPKVIINANRVASMNVIAYSYRHNLDSISGGGKYLLSSIKIYDFCFKAGYGLLILSNDISTKDKKIAADLYECSVNRYINAVISKLLYIRFVEIFKFAMLCVTHRYELKKILPFCSTATKCVIKYPFISCSIISVFRFVWIHYKKIISKYKSYKSNNISKNE